MSEPADQSAAAPHPLRRLVHNLALATAILAGAALALAWLYPIQPLAAPDDPAALELLAVRVDALRFQVALGLGLCALLLLLTLYPRRALGALLLMGWALVPTLLVLHEERAPARNAGRLRLLSLNLAGDLAETTRVVRAVESAEADVVFFQEYTPARHIALERALGKQYPTRFQRARSDSFGMAVYARVPVRDLTSFHLADSRTPQFRMVVELEGADVALYAIHLLPIVSHLYPRHRREYVDLLRRVAQETQPVVLAGDFNFVNHSAFGRVLRERGFLDTHPVAGPGRGATWPTVFMGIGIPGIRLDHIFVGPTLTATEAWIGAVTGSDHLPIGAAITPAQP